MKCKCKWEKPTDTLEDDQDEDVGADEQFPRLNGQEKPVGKCKANKIFNTITGEWEDTE